MNGSKSNPQVAHLARMNCMLEAERNTLFDALTGLLRHIELSAAGRAGLQATLVCGVPIDDRYLEAAVRHALFVRDNEAMAATKAVNGQLEATALQ